LKVLHLPYNVASQVSVSVQGLRAIGVNSRGLIAATQGDVIQSHDGIDVLRDAPLSWSIRSARQRVGLYEKLMAAIAWADILHWHYGWFVLARGFDLFWARLLRKPGIAEFWGTDIRDAEIEAADNPYFARYVPQEYRARQTGRSSYEIQARFARAGFSCIVADNAMLAYVRRELFPKVYLVRQRVLLSEYVPSPPDPGRQRPLIVHSPSHPRLKGSEFVQAAVEKLRSKYDFEFRLVSGLPRREALAILSDADIFVDQLILGEHGVATLEAMALAKPVVCYIKPSMASQYPSDLPVISAHPENITEVLEGLITSGARRRDLGLRGRNYVEKHHDAIDIARQLKNIYQETLEKRSPTF